MTTTTPKPTAQDQDEAVHSDFAPFYALAGLTDLLGETVVQKLAPELRNRIEQSQQRLDARVAELRGRSVDRLSPPDPDEVQAFLRGLPDQLRDLPIQARSQLMALQRQAETYRTTAAETYATLAGRGKVAVGDAVASARSAGRNVQHQADQAWEEAAEDIDPTLEKVQESVTEARRTATGHSATATTTPRSSVKAARTRAAKKAPATKTAAKKTTAKKTTAEKAAPTKAPATKAAAAKTAAPATKAAAKKAPAKKTAVKKATARKTAS